MKVDDREKTAGYLTGWLKEKGRKPKTLHRYSKIITKELIPALGAIPLEQLHHDHVAVFIAELEDADRGAPDDPLYTRGTVLGAVGTQ